MDDSIKALDTAQKLVTETALINWRELQRFFAQGLVIKIDISQDLIVVATMFAEDNVDELSRLMETGKVSPPSNDQARSWYDADAELWSVVVAPFVLVQEQISNNQ